MILERELQDIDKFLHVTFIQLLTLQSELGVPIVTQQRKGYQFGRTMTTMQNCQPGPKIILCQTYRNRPTKCLELILLSASSGLRAIPKKAGKTIWNISIKEKFC